MKKRSSIHLHVSTVLSAAVLLLSIPALRAQDYEAGLYAGGSYYLGDLNPAGHFKNTRPAFGALIRYNLDDRWTVKVSAYRGEVKGSSASTNFLPDRDLSFVSPVTDISAEIEFSFFPYFTGSRKTWITPYVYTGVGMTLFDPKSGGTRLQPLGTEGQNVHYDGRKPYHLTNLNLPFGLGAKISLAKNLGLTVFWEMHKLFTDYLDDVSTTYYLNGPSIDPNDPAQYYSDPTQSMEPGMQRGNSRNWDWYSFSGITLTYKFALGKGRHCRDLKHQ